MAGVRQGVSALRAVLYAFVLSVPFETILYFKNEGEQESAVSITRMLGVALFALSVAQFRSTFRRVPAAFWLLAWYLAAYTVSQLWIPSALDGRFREQQVTLFMSAGLFLISFNLFTDEAFRARLLRSYGWGVSVVAFLMVTGLVGAQYDKEGRGSMLTQNPNLTAALFAFGALCLAGDLTAAGRSMAWALPSVAAAGVLVAGILRTGSRSGLLALGGGVLALAAAGGSHGWRRRVLAAGMVLGVGGLLLKAEFANNTSTAARIERSWTDGDTAGRTAIYDRAWEMIGERPLFGWGGAQNRFILGTDLNRVDSRGGKADRDTHNVFLAVLTEVGLVGGLPFIAALALSLWTGWRAARGGDPLPFALMCALVIMNMFVTGIREKMFWVVLAAASAAGRRRPRTLVT